MKTPTPHKHEFHPNLPNDPELEAFLRRHITDDGQVVEPPENEELPVTVPESSFQTNKPCFEPPPNLAAILRALAHPDRLEIVALLEDGELAAGVIDSYLDMNQSTASRHLAALRRAGVVRVRAESAARFYRLADPALPSKLAALIRPSLSVV